MHRLGRASYWTTSSLTFATPPSTIPSVSAAAWETSTTRPRTYGPRSLTRTVTDCPLATFVTRSRVPNGNVGWAAVNSCVFNFTGRGLCSFRVEAGDPIRCDLCPGGSFVRCERTVLSCDRHAPFWCSIVILGCIPGTPGDLARSFRILLVATWVCVQAASEAAPRITASNCTTLRSPEPKLKGALMQMRLALILTYEVLAQLLENISSPAYRIPTRKGRNPIGAEQVKRELLRHHSRDFMSVLSLSHIGRAVPLRAKVNGHDRSSWPSACSTCVAILGYRNRTSLRARTGGIPEAIKKR